MQLAGVDLNLLVSLDALLEERSVVRAAKRVGLSPSAMSHSLARLRDLFDDPLLVRGASGMVPTPGAEALRQHVRQALDHVRAALEAAPAFDPASSSCVFRLSASDDIQTMILPPLLRRLDAAAPGVTVVSSDAEPAARTAAGLANGELDAAIGQFGPLSGIRRDLLFETRIVCLARAGHPRIRDRLTLRQYLAEGHVAVRPRMDPPLNVDHLLGQQGMRRRIAASVCSLDVAPLVVAKTDLLCSAAERVIQSFVGDLGLRVFEHPAQPPPQKIHLAWPDRLHESPAHRWFRSLLHTCVAPSGPGRSAAAHTGTALARGPRSLRSELPS